MNQAQQQFTDKKYPDMITTLLQLKTHIPGYEPVRVDGLIWLGLRYNGVHLIQDTNRLTDGLYYLDLATNYAPLDKEASGKRISRGSFWGYTKRRTTIKPKTSKPV